MKPILNKDNHQKVIQIDFISIEAGFSPLIMYLSVIKALAKTYDLLPFDIV